MNGLRYIWERLWVVRSHWIYLSLNQIKQIVGILTLLLVGVPESCAGVTPGLVRTYYAFATLKPALDQTWHWRLWNRRPTNRRVKCAECFLWTLAYRSLKVCHFECQAFSCTQKVGMEKFWGKLEVLLKFFIHHTKSLVILLISSINSLLCPLSSCLELVPLIIGTNRHLGYQSIYSEMNSIIAVQATWVNYKASKCFTYVALSASVWHKA